MKFSCLIYRTPLNNHRRDVGYFDSGRISLFVIANGKVEELDILLSLCQP